MRRTDFAFGVSFIGRHYSTGTPCVRKTGFRIPVMILFLAFCVKSVFGRRNARILLAFFEILIFDRRKSLGNPAITNIIVHRQGDVFSRTRKERKIDDAGVGGPDRVGGRGNGCAL